MVANIPDHRWLNRDVPLIIARQAEEFPDDGCMKLLGLTPDSPIIDFADRLIWGTFGRPAQYPLQWKRLRELDTEHLENILISQRQIPLIYSKAIMALLRERHATEGTVQ